MLELESDPYSMFVFAMNAKQTRDKYTARLKRFFDFIKIPGNNIEEQCKVIVQMERSLALYLFSIVLDSAVP
jgi:hypothetical protein